MGKAKTFFTKNSSASAIILLFILGFSVYANSLPNQMFWDDNDGILNNVYVKNFEIKKFFSENLIAGAGFQSNYWRPMLLITYAIEWKIWGEWTYGYHAVNTLIHIGNAILLFFILAYISKSFFIRFFTSLIFIIHPLQTEAITYVSGRGDPLSFFFILLGILFFLTAFHRGEKEVYSASPRTYNVQILFFLLSIFMFILALFTKERAVIFPAYLLLFEFWFWIKNRMELKKFLKKTFVLLLPFVLIACIYLLLRGTALNFQNTFNIYNTNTPYTESILVRTYTFLKILPEYFGLYFFPKTLFMERSEIMSYAETIFNPYVLMGICISLILIFFSFFKFKEKPEYAFGLMFLFIAFFPASGIIVPVAGIMFEHYMYAPIIGISLLFALFILYIFKLRNSCSSKEQKKQTLTFYPRSGVKCKNGKYVFFSYFFPLLVIISIITWILFLSSKTIARNAEWSDPITFYEQTLAHAPTSLRVWNNLGMAYADKGMNDKAIYAYARAIELNPQNPIPYHNMGNIYEDEKNIEMAKKYWQTAVSLNPQFIQPHLKLEEYKNKQTAF